MIGPNYDIDFQHFFSLNLDLLCIAKLEGTFVKLNKSWETVLGYSLDELEGQSFMRFVHPDDIEATLKSVSDLSENKQVLNFINRYRCKNGNYKYIEWNSRPYGDIVYAAARDITGRKEMENNLEKQKNFFQQILNAIPDLIFCKDISSRYLGCNKAFVEGFMGLKEQDIINKSDLELFKDENLINHFIKTDADVLEAEKTIVSEEKIRMADQTVVYAETIKTPFYDENGKLAGLIGISRDISIRKNIEKQMRASEEKFRHLAEVFPETIYEADINGNITYSNQHGFDRFGYSPEDVQKGLNIMNFIYPREREIALFRIREKISGIENGYIEFTAVCKDGTTFPAMGFTSVVMENDAPVGLRGFILDISERRKFEEEMHRKERILSAVAMSIKELIHNRDYYSAISDCFAIIGSETGVDRVYLFENTYDENGMGYASQKIEWNSGAFEPQIDNQNLQNIPFDDILHIISNLQEGRAYHGIVKDISDVTTKEHLESQNILSVVIMPIFINGVFWGFMGFDECKYERVWTEGEFSTLGAFVNSLEKAIERSMIEEELEKSRKAAEAANIMKGQFLANMSHEIRTPMNGILGFLELLQTTDLSFEQIDYLREAKRASEILLYLINDILDISKIEAGKLTIEETSFKVRTAVEDAVSVMVPKAAEKGIDIYTYIKPCIPEEVIGDPARLKQVLNNLLSNAVKFTEKGQIDVTVGCGIENDGKHQLIFEVRDTGIGIKNEVIDKLFRPFTQADTSTTRKFGGTGLGLAISRELVKLMGGDMEVESLAGQGSLFKFSVFLKVSKKSTDRWSVMENGKVNILLIGDNPNNNKIVTGYLDEAGFKVLEAKNTDDVEKILSDVSKIKMIVFDFDFKDGYELLNNIKAVCRANNIKLVLISSVARYRDESIKKEYEFSKVITRPVRRDELIECIIGVLDEKEEIALDNKAALTRAKYDIKVSRAKILLVEDNDINRKIVVTMLKTHGMFCDIAVDGSEAVKAVAEKDYDVVFMDCQMPVMDGYEATFKIREMEGDRKHTAIIAMTANAMEGDREICIKAGMDDYISKPINFSLMLQMIESNLKESINDHRELIDDSIDKFIESTGINKEAALEIFEEFIKTLSEAYKSMERTFRSNDFLELSRLAHQLKGSSGNLRVGPIFEQAKKLNEAALEQNTVECEMLLSELKVLML